MCYLAGIPRRLAHCRENPYQLLTDWVKDPEPANGIRHEVRRQLDLVGTVGFRTADERLSLEVPPAARLRIRALQRNLGITPLEPVIVVHPGATAPSRRYPPEFFADAARQLHIEDGAQIILTGSADEKDLLNNIQRRMDVPAVNLAGLLSLAELAALISEATVLVVNNTGPAHMAAALGTPVVDLYALTNPQHTPWQVTSRVLSHDVPCRNCFKSVCPEGHGNCLRLIPPSAVVAAVRELSPNTLSRRSLCTRSA
jgi:lipopolysaccharide heptosyltransferase II